ncbi:hypothetical protein NAEGRDRAFT_59386 [Naegleria gruberi]|uniref:Uncharacterized protein n=1 Tax=Naegleria gruberi TaxID=5762 RepID=D2VW66_NAEGR|nr:uncharacterized protein NAEGRDRAFT_59386 [Naegleria gruberi]EFC39025.1 hypothetical protein NAEGRDRAFT_59386 [Naegleria gruberi]|eukprot:XP_002671769.1 hypothetical protein NAEGRDRAFT_59386 [Naegleria gruberi strain NEG-M]
MRPNKNSSPSASTTSNKDEQSFMNQLKVEEPIVKRKRGNSMTFRFKSLKEDEVKQLYESFQVQNESGRQYGLTSEDFMQIFEPLQAELIKQLKILFDQYVEDSDDYEMFLIDRIQKRNPNDFPEVFSKPIVTKSAGALLNVHSTNQSKTPSPNTSSLTREHSFPPTITTSSEEISTCESMSPVSPSNDHSPIHVTPQQTERSKLFIPIPNSNHRNSSEFDNDTWSEPMASPRKLKALFSVEEKKKKKKEKAKTERKVQSIQEQMNKYNKIISSLYKDLIERDLEIQQLKQQVAQFEDNLSTTEDEHTETEELESFDEL